MCYWNRKSSSKLRFGGLLGSWERWTVVFFFMIWPQFGGRTRWRSSFDSWARALAKLGVTNEFSSFALACRITNGEYRFAEKNWSTFQGLFQGHFHTFQGHFHCRSRCITVKKYRVTGQNLEFPCNLPSSHRSVRTGRWKLLLFFFFFTFFVFVFHWIKINL